MTATKPAEMFLEKVTTPKNDGTKENEIWNYVNQVRLNVVDQLKISQQFWIRARQIASDYSSKRYRQHHQNGDYQSTQELCK